MASIAHELRTPLNTMIPMSLNLKQYITSERGLLLLKIIINSSIHLQHVVEDALDLSRIENNKFEISLAFFDIRKTIYEVKDTMEFQI